MPPPKQEYFPLRWESTGNQWWYASPIDWASANGHYDVVRELLHLDTNLLIKLTSLPRLRRLETVWDDNDVAKCRAHVAHCLFLECPNSLLKAGYGGWLMYTAAAAADVQFVHKLLERDPLLVFGEGEYGVTDVLYAAARSRDCEVFRLVFGSCVGVKGVISEMMNRAVHAAARGGSLDILTELLAGDDLFGYRDAMGSTLLHTASGRGQLQVVEHLISTYEDIITSVDIGGNTALNIAAYRGHLPVLELLISTSPSLVSLSNNYGDTFLHMAVSGFLAPGFRRLDRQLEVITRLVTGTLVDIHDLINVQNNQGRTALHMAVIDNIQPKVVDLLMSVPCINLNIKDGEGHTPLDLLKLRPHSEILMKRFISAGGISNCDDKMTRNALVSHLRRHGIGGSPGTSFRIPDSEILLHTAAPSGSDFSYSGEIEPEGADKMGSTSRFTNLFRFSRKNGDDASEDYCIRSYKKTSPIIPLRIQFSRASSLPCNKRVESYNTLNPSPSTKKKFTTGLTQGVLQLLPKPYFGSPSSSFSSPLSAKGVDDGSRSEIQSPNMDSVKTRRKHGPLNINSYLCFGAQGLAMDNSIN